MQAAASDVLTRLIGAIESLLPIRQRTVHDCPVETEVSSGMDHAVHPVDPGDQTQGTRMSFSLSGGKAHGGAGNDTEIEQRSTDIGVGWINVPRK